jgi:hypothetical protein
MLYGMIRQDICGLIWESRIWHGIFLSPLKQETSVGQEEVRRAKIARLAGQRMSMGDTLQTETQKKII